MSYLSSIFDDINYIHNFNYLYNYDVFDFLNSFLYDFLLKKRYNFKYIINNLFIFRYI